MPRFSVPQRCLIENWSDARLLEEAMKDVRKKYVELFDTVQEEVQENYPTLNASKTYFSRDGLWYGGIAFGKKTWPKGRYGWPSGFEISNIQLENLLSPDLEAPAKWIWIYNPKVKKAEVRFRRAAEKVLGKAGSRRWKFDSNNEALGIWCPLEPRVQLIKLLLKEDSRGFIDSIVSHFQEMAKFTSAFDEIANSTKRH